MAASVTPGRALRYAGGSARGLLHQALGHYRPRRLSADRAPRAQRFVRQRNFQRSRLSPNARGRKEQGNRPNRCPADR
ncbi:hypothetical protein Salmuc_01165 [Salipiger mucosus DSM 16094]|uniref:Uncharacterized protein n=1 Tax=Salipiger mucosus DSM 16094 TaxID=1123237 RepID=S9RC64_9RHOB|nr:hypothetical protein Salmuc_01165 [Salipiger mucosus DSM 16094]